MQKNGDRQGNKAGARPVNKRVKRTTTKSKADMKPVSNASRPNKNHKAAKTIATKKKTTIVKKAVPRKKNKSSLDEYRKKQELRRIQNTKSYSLIFVMSIIFIAVIVYMCQALFFFLNKPVIPTVTVEYGNIDLPKPIDGVIIRDERVYTSTTAGSVNFVYGDFDRVKKGAVICTIQDQEAISDVKADAEKLDSNILNLQDRRGEYSTYSQDVQRTNKEIQKIVDNNVYQYIDNNISTVYSLKENVSRNISLRNQMLLTENRGSVKDMVEERSVYDKQLSESKASIAIENSGTISYTVDGLESSLTFENMKSLTPEQTRMKKNYDELERKKNVVANDSIFKIVQSNDWYIALYVPSDVAYEWEKGTSKEVYIQEDEGFDKIEMTVDEIQKGEKESFILFKSSKRMIDFLLMRSVKVKLEDSDHQGLKIPNSAVVDKTFLKIPNEFVYETETNTPVIMRQGLEIDETVPIIKQDKDDDFTYILQDFNNLKIGDVLVKNDDKSKTHVISDVINVKGVYAINNGYANFRKINISRDMPESVGYLILDPEMNKGIRVYDRIISDTMNIEEGQKVN